MAAENESPSPLTLPSRGTPIEPSIDGAIESTLETVRAARVLPALNESSPNTETSVAARRLRHLSEIGLALSAERDIGRLLAMILTTSRQLTSSDGGTLYIVEKSSNGEKNLFFRAAQNDTIVVDTKMSFAVSPSSLAGYVALTGEILRFDDVYHLSPEAPYKFNPLFDVEHNYKTQSVLVVPLKNHIGEVIGVLQLINRKRHRKAILSDVAAIEREVLGFDDDMMELAATLASQAAVALNNNLLLREIEDLFESLVVASASAIEDRDPTTSGHSKRVTKMTV
jgi:GAF domain-containing protein